MLDIDNISAECQVYSRYLTGMPADDYIGRKYIEAFQNGGVLNIESPVYFDQLLLRLAVIHPFITHAVDIYSRFFRSDSVVRKRLVFLLALLESWGPTASYLDKPGVGGKVGFIIGMIFRVLLMILLLLIMAIFLFPVQFITNKSTEKV